MVAYLITPAAVSTSHEERPDLEPSKAGQRSRGNNPASNPSESVAALPSAESRAPTAGTTPPQAALVSFRLLNTEDVPIEGVRLEWTVTGSPKLGGAFKEESGGNLSDLRGEVSVRGRIGQFVRFAVADDSWYATAGKFAIESDTSTIEVRLRRGAAFSAQIVYADGVAFSGLVIIDCDGRRDRFAIAETGKLRTGTLPLEEAFRVIVFSRRAGYDKHQFVIEPAQRGLNVGESTLTIPESEVSTGVLVVRFDQDDEITGLRVEVYSVEKAACIASGVAPIGQWRSPPITPGRYLVKILGPVCWQGEALVEPKQETVVVPVLLPGGGAEAVISDMDGAPLPGGVLRIKDGKYTSWVNISSQRGALALADSKGNARLDCLPAGNQTFVIESHGYNPQEITVNVQPGMVISLGAIKLTRAAGRISVRLLNVDRESQYKVLLFQPGGAVIESISVENGKEIAFSGLSGREYVVGVIRGTGGKVVSSQASLDKKESVELVLDASALND